MSLDSYIAKHRVRILKSKTRKGALSELVRAATRDLPGVSHATLLRAVWEREALLTTRIAPEIAIPHARIEGVEKTLIVVGKSHDGVLYDRLDGSRVFLFFLIVGGAHSHLKALGAVASLLQDPVDCQRLVAAGSREELLALLVAGPSGDDEAQQISAVTQAVCDQAVRLAEQIGAGVVMMHDPPPAIGAVLAHSGNGIRLIFTSHETLRKQDGIAGVVQLEVPFRGLSRSSHLEISLLLALSKGLIQKGEKVVSVFGLSSATLDTIVVTDVNREFKLYFSMPVGAQPEDMEQQVFIRVLQLATELSHEGREGKPVGTLFVIGDNQKVMQHCQQMVINPFKGYDDHERNILDPGLAETIKEFSHIDGAFIIRGDGVIVAAGSYLRVDHPVDHLPSGLGARHAAAAAITAVTGAIAVAVSESTRKVSVFRAGQRVMEL